MPQKWFAQTSEEVLGCLKTDISRGLSKAEAERRLKAAQAEYLAEIDRLQRR